MKKHFLSFVLVLIMVLTLIPTIPFVSAEVQPVNTVKTVATGQLSGEQHFLAVRVDNSLWAWGNNAHGQLGDGTTIDRTSSNPVKVMDNVKFVAAEQGFSMAITNDGVLYSWGTNTYGRLGDGTVTNRHSPVRVMDNVTYVTLGRDYAFALRGDGGLYSWGENIGGSLGNGGPNYGATNQHSPVKIMDNVINVGTGINVVNWAVKSDNSLWVWGGMFDSTIQTFANVRTSSTPIRIASSNVAAMEMVIMGRALFILRPSGDVHGLGENEEGQLGDGTGINKDELVWITNDVISVKTFSDSVFAIKCDNSLWGWGDHHRLRQINGNLTSSGKAYSPVKLLDGVLNVIYSGSFSTYVLKTDGTLWEYRLLGEPTILMSDIAIPPSEAPNLSIASQWAHENLNNAFALGLIPRNLQSKYTQATTRAEFCALAVALYETVTGTSITERSTFGDTSNVNVEKMAALGVVNGTGNNQFSPNNELTREQAATMLSRLADAIGKPLQKQNATFNDNSSISSWAIEAVGQMQVTGIMGGVGNNTFAPKEPYTREQSIITILRLYNVVK